MSESMLTNEHKVMVELGSYIEKKMREQESYLREQGILKPKQSLSQSKLANLIGVSPVWINNIIRGDKFPSDEILCGIANTLNIKEEELFKVARRLPPKIVEEIKKDFLGDKYIPNLKL